MTENQTETPQKNHRNLLIGAIVVLVVVIVVVFALIFVTRDSNQESVALPATTEVAQATATITPETEEPEEPTATVTEEAPAPTEEPTAEPTDEPAPTLEPTEAPPAGPPADPQEIEFQASDGVTLKGRYYPAAFEGAPVIVLMHWAGGDRNDWNEIAFWLQNRGLNGTSPNLGTTPWLDPSWFPAMPAGKSYAVFTFSFRGYEDNLNGGPADWLLDAQAGVQAARQFGGRVVAIGASIGADGAVDGCGAGNCLGALSLSPGNYLNLAYAEAVQTMDEAGNPTRCFFSVGDNAAAEACGSASGDHYQTTQWPDDRHGMRLLEPQVDPSAMQMIIEFLAFLGL